MNRRCVFTVTAAMLALPFAGVPALAADHKIEISLETGPNHIRNISVVELAEELEAASDGRLEVKVFHGASKYKGTNVPTALAQGALDMGMPGTWHLGKFVPDFNMTGLPMFYGRGRDAQYAVWDGEVGQAMNQKLEEKLGVVVIGRWFDLGFGQMFFSEKEVTSHTDLVGLKMRAPGGAANLARFKEFDATAVKIAWPDVPQALQRNTVDGVLTTHESVRSAKLWDSGLKYAYDDDQSFFQYVPVMSRRAWDQLPEDLQTLIVDTWEAKVDSVRELAAERQKSAREEGAANGIKLTRASDDDLVAMREKLMASQPGLVEELRIDGDLVAKAGSALAATN
ncbi:MAG: TRAP transporter substrate-binding protein DctP [Geminicoccaceae bacterium]